MKRSRQVHVFRYVLFLVFETPHFAPFYWFRALLFLPGPPHSGFTAFYSFVHLVQLLLLWYLNCSNERVVFDGLLRVERTPASAAGNGREAEGNREDGGRSQGS